MADKLNDAAEILARAGMLAAGYHERKGERRRRRDAWAWAHGRGARAGGATAGPLGEGPGRRGRRKDGAALGPPRKLAGVDPTPPEVLLSERVASPWVLVELQEALFAA